MQQACYVEDTTTQLRKDEQMIMRDNNNPFGNWCLPVFPTAGIIRDPLGVIGVPVGDSKDVAPFHSSAFALSLAPHLPESIQGIPEKGVLSFAGSVPQNGKWYEAFITHPHDPAFWSELEQLLHSLAPGEKYCILIQPQLSHGSHVTLDGSFLTDSNPNMQVLQDHFQPSFPTFPPPITPKGRESI